MDRLHTHCVLAVELMVKEGIVRHISYVSDEDDPNFAVPDEHGCIPKVTIEWVDASEAEPINAAA